MRRPISPNISAVYTTLKHLIFPSSQQTSRAYIMIILIRKILMQFISEG